tara:strand:- start:812 stop:1117 length:306 start_codon:yes stop_codon:yes gene_type:complete
MKEMKEMKEIKFSDGQEEINGFVLAVKDAPKGRDIKKLHAYSGGNLSKPLHIDTSSFNDTGTVWIKTDIKPSMTITLQYEKDDNKRNDVWSNCKINQGDSK